MIETYKFRIYPTKEQEVLLQKHFGCVRFIYNWALDFNKKLYAQTRKYKNYVAINCDGDLIKLKQEKEWLKEVNSQSLISSIGHLDWAFNRFFKGLGGFPKFKKKELTAKSFEVPQHFDIDFKNSSIQIPKFCKKNKIRCKISRKVNMNHFKKFGTATISQNSSGQYFVSFIVHRDEEPKQPISDNKISENNSLGFDFGLKHFLTLSDGRTFDSPEYFKKMLDKLAWEQRKLSKKQKGSKNKEKQRIKVAKIHQKISDQRNDFLHKLSTSLVKESQFDCFCFEDLNLKGMKKLWGRKVSDLSYFTFQTMMFYKASRAGKVCAKVGRFDPSSQICSKCGHRQKMPLDVRTYECPECGQVVDRDLNAAINIRNFALRNILKNTEGTSGINACGDGSSGKCGANRVRETTVDKARKSKHCKKCKEEAQKITPFKV